MSEKRSYVTSISLYEDEFKSKEIDSLYAQGKTFTELAEKFNCSENTMIITVGMLGYPVYPYAMKEVKKNLKKI
jgi:hypothetical protein